MSRILERIALILENFTAPAKVLHRHWSAIVGAAKYVSTQISTLNSSQQKSTHIYAIVYFYVYMGFKMTKRLTMAGLEPASVHHPAGVEPAIFRIPSSKWDCFHFSWRYMTTFTFPGNIWPLSLSSETPTYPSPTPLMASLPKLRVQTIWEIAIANLLGVTPYWTFAATASIPKWDP